MSWHCYTFAETPKITVPSHGHHASCLRGIDDIESACRSARALENEYLFERVHVPSGTWSRWAFLSETGFVKARNYVGPTVSVRHNCGPPRDTWEPRGTAHPCGWEFTKPGTHSSIGSGYEIWQRVWAGAEARVTGSAGAHGAETDSGR